MSINLTNYKISLIVTGSIAAFKACIIIRELIKCGASVQVIVTKSASEFIGKTTFTTLSGKPVLSDLFPETSTEGPVHLQTSQWADILLIAPCTANFIGKMANGIADDLASASAIAFPKKVVVAPAMNPKIWDNKAVQRNVATLKNWGIEFIGPESGLMGGVTEEPGFGRMSEPEKIIAQLEKHICQSKEWIGRKIVVTSGPTREALDPVRFISNRSSGRMGDAIAKRAFANGADVVLIRGKGAVGNPPSGVTLVEVDTASEMSDCVKQHFPECDALIMVAAISDWTVKNRSTEKLKKIKGAPTIEWKETEDILSWAGKNKSGQVVVGFALETFNHLEAAREKLLKKNADLIVLNDPTKSGSEFGGNTIKLTIISSDSSAETLQILSKDEAAEKLLSDIYAHFNKLQSNP